MSIWVKCDASAGLALTERGRVRSVRTPFEVPEEYQKESGRPFRHDSRGGIFSGVLKGNSPSLGALEDKQIFVAVSTAVDGYE